VDKEANEPVEASCAATGGTVDGLQLVQGQDAIPRGAVWRFRDRLHRGPIDEVLTDAPREERAADSGRVLLLARPIIEAVELPDDLAGRNVADAFPSDRVMGREVAPVEPNGDRPKPGLAVLEELVASVLEGGVLWTYLPERLFGEDAAGFGLASDRVSPPGPYRPMVWRRPLPMSTQNVFVPLLAETRRPKPLSELSQK
jgi:hypothetical protein